MPHFDIAFGGLAFLAQLDGALGDLGGFITDALDIDHRLGDADDQPQVGGGRLATGQNAHAFLVNRRFHLVDLLVDFAHLLGQAGVSLDQRGHRVIHLFFHQPAHGQQVAAYLFQLGVELGGDVLREVVFVDHVKAPKNR